MPKHHALFGHLIVLKEIMQSLPRNTVMHVVVQRIAKSFPGGVFYLNLWPFNAPVMVVANPYVASQVEAAFLDKPANICATIEVINGGPSLMTMHGSTWKKWRTLFNPGFATGYITFSLYSRGNHRFLQTSSRPRQEGGSLCVRGAYAPANI
jgi:fluoride ion exporter CrcB/FEX